MPLIPPGILNFLGITRKILSYKKHDLSEASLGPRQNSMMESLAKFYLRKMLYH